MPDVALIPERVGRDVDRMCFNAGITIDAASRDRFVELLVEGGQADYPANKRSVLMTLRALSIGSQYEGVPANRVGLYYLVFAAVLSGMAAAVYLFLPSLSKDGGTEALTACLMLMAFLCIYLHFWEARTVHHFRNL